ncbi:MAG: RNA polymerase sigma factor, partial [Acidobacteria bacterium]|nr:RNA polymerase sigma factor [Acidobacteriota bacterium]
MLDSSESALIERARAGDRDAFAQLYDPLERPLRAFLYRMTAAAQDAEDLAQEIALQALETIAHYKGASSFRIWIFGRAAEAALEYLRGQKQWDPDALIRAGRRAAEKASERRKLQKIHKSKLHTTYAIEEHIDFCFTCMGRCLPPHEEAALLLAEVHGFSDAEAAETLGISVQAVRFRVLQARQALVDHFDSRCSLINKDGTCSECAGLHTLLHGDHRRTEQTLFRIDLQQRATPGERAAGLDQRLAIVRAIDPLYAEGTR